MLSIRENLHSRRSFLKLCATLASLLGLPPAMLPRIAKALEQTPRQPVIWLNFQDCTACSESFWRSHTPSLEDFLFTKISLDYHHSLQAAAGATSEQILATTIQQGHYLLIVEGSIPLANPGYCTIGGVNSRDLLRQVAGGAEAIIAVGTCASFGGIPHAVPNPTGAVAIQELLTTTKPLANVSGCPPVPLVITGLLSHFLLFGEFPELDEFKRPLTFFGNTIHKQCNRRHFFNAGQFAETFDDEGAKQGWCLFKLGCKGTLTHNACPTLKWNGTDRFPIAAGHGCLGCAEPHFWDNGSFYRSLAAPSSSPELPKLGPGNAVNSQGEPIPTQTTFAGGLAIPEGLGEFHRSLTVRLTTPVKITGSITVDPTHLDQPLDLLVLAAYRPLLATTPWLYFMRDTTGNLFPWDENPAHLIAFQSQVTLTAPVTLYQGYFVATGSLKVHFGYRLPDGTVVTSSQSIDITITE